MWFYWLPLKKELTVLSLYHQTNTKYILKKAHKSVGIGFGWDSMAALLLNAVSSSSFALSNTCNNVKAYPPRTPRFVSPISLSSSPRMSPFFLISFVNFTVILYLMLFDSRCFYLVGRRLTITAAETDTNEGFYTYILIV